MQNLYLTFGLIVISDRLSPWHGASWGCRWRRWPPDMENGCRYIE